MTNVTFFVTVNADGAITHVAAHSQGVDYRPVDQNKANDMHRFTFQMPLIEDTTPAIRVSVHDGIATGERLGN